MPAARLSAFAAALLALVALRQDGVQAGTDFSDETEFGSSDPSKYPDTGNVVPYQPVSDFFRAGSRATALLRAPCCCCF